MNRSIVVSPKLAPSVIIKPESPSIGENVIIAISVGGNSIDNAKVKITKPDGNSEIYLSDSDGKVRFIPTLTGWYSVKVEKKEYNPVDVAFQVKPSHLSLRLSSEEVELGDSVKISAIDDDGNEIPVEFIIKNPDGTRELVSKDTYIPLSVGNYEVSISNAAIPITKTFTVKPYPLELETSIRNNKLIIRAISHAKPVQGLTVLIETPTEKRNLLTDSEGIAIFDIKNSGTVKIIANDKRYKQVQITKNVVKGHDYTLLTLTAILIITVSVIAIFLLSRKGSNVKKKGSKEKKGILRKSKTSSLSSV